MSPWTDPSQNPYVSPQGDPPTALRPPIPFSGPRIVPLARREIELDGRRYELGAIVYPSCGTDAYTIDGYIRKSSICFWGRRRMAVGDGPCHALEIRVNPFGARRLYLDGRLIDADLFPELKTQYALAGTMVCGVFGIPAGVVALTLALELLLVLLGGL